MNTVKITFTSLALVALVATSGIASVAVADESQLRGRNLMSNGEWQAHRDAMQRMSSQQQRQQYRAAVQEQMRVRALEQGVELSGSPSARGGQGCLNGSGQGRGPGKRYGL